jgi:hypothetical protein
MYRTGLALLAGIGGMTPSIAFAQPAPAPPTLGLTDAEKADLLSHNTESSVDAARTGLGGAPGPDRQIHGAIGTVIGTHGLRSTYGGASIPLGNNAQANVYFEDSHYGRPR